MKDPSSSREFNKIAKFFHWLIFLLILFQYVIAITVYGLTNQDYYPKDLFMGHKAVGALIFLLAIGRLIWRKLKPLPSWPDSMTEFEKKSFHFFEVGLYTLMFLMPISGMLFSIAAGYGFSDSPELIGENPLFTDIGKYLHRIMAFLLVGFISSHVSLILRNHFDSKENFIDRMSFFKSKEKSLDK
jgi:cytochrome b561